MATCAVDKVEGRWLFRQLVIRFAQCVPLLLIGLIFLGSLVTSHDAGLSVPDWPTSYGEPMFQFPQHKWIGGVMYEHVHRLVASVVGLAVCLTAIGVWLIERRTWMRMLALGSGFAVCFQGLLGGLTVLYGLPDAISVAHGVLAQSILVLSIVIAWAVRRGDGAARLTTTPAAEASLLLAALVYLQLIFGAMLRHAGAALAVPDFPLFGGMLWPSVSTIQLFSIELGRMAPSDYQVAIHVLHRIWGALLLLGCLAFWRKACVSLRWLPRVIGVLAILQVLLGASVVWTGRLPFIASLHVLGGAVLLSSLVVAGLTSLGEQEKGA